MDKAQIERTLRRIYALRAANDAKGLVQAFAPHARYRVLGDPTHCPAAREHQGETLGEAMARLCDLFPAHAFNIVATVIEDDKAAVRVWADLVFAPTGEAVSSEIAHFWTFEGGHAVELAEFFDTAHVAHLLNAGAWTPTYA